MLTLHNPIKENGNRNFGSRFLVGGGEFLTSTEIGWCELDFLLILRANGEHEFSCEVLTTPDCAAGFGAGFDLHCVRSLFRFLINLRLFSLRFELPV